MSDHSESQAETIALLNLLALEEIGSGTAIRLVSEFGSAQAVFSASEARLRGVPHFGEVLIARLHAARADGDAGKRQYDEAHKSGVEIRTYWDAGFPPSLRELQGDAPALLFIRGTLEAEARRVAVVGTRSATSYGKRMTHDLIVGLRGSGVHIVSGLASGIDGFSHEAALEAGLITEAVFGCGVDHIYPSINTTLANRILAAGGALVSEYPLGTSPERYHFPQRNRIIAGLSQATLVVEAGDKSGALITAMLAAEYNREVAAVPGAVTSSRSAGCLDLIKSGAALVAKPQDILDLIKVKGRAEAAASAQATLTLDDREQKLYGTLDATEGCHIDDIAAKAGVPVGEALGQLLLLELKGAVKQLPGKYFVRA